MTDILIWGVGDASTKIEQIINYKNVNIIAYIDNNKDRQGKLKNNKPIISPDAICKYKYKYIFIASQYYMEIYNQLISLDIKESEIINSYKLVENIIELERIKSDRNYLHKKLTTNYHEAKKNRDIDTIITGISYAECGIDLNSFKYRTINLALSGQDLYYDYNIAKNIIEVNKDKLQNVIIGLCYYSFQYDLSLSNAKSRCIYVYKDILNLIHNYKNSEDMKAELLNYIDGSIKMNENLFLSDANLILENLKINFEVNFEKNWSNNFNNISLEDKINRSKQLAIIDSNKNYPNTLIENKEILSQYLQFLHSKDINVAIVVFPVTKYYREYFDERLKNEFYGVLEDLKGKYQFKFFDYFSSDEFSDKDFSDCSHLNLNGASKFAEILNEKI